MSTNDQTPVSGGGASPQNRPENGSHLAADALGSASACLGVRSASEDVSGGNAFGEISILCAGCGRDGTGVMTLRVADGDAAWFCGDCAPEPERLMGLADLRAGLAQVYGADVAAPGEIGIEDAGCVQVVMPPAALAAYRHWLTGRDLHLYRIPGLSDGDLPTYAIGIGAERPGAAGGVS